MNIYKCENLKATFTLKEIVKVDGEECAKIVGELSNWPADHSPTFSCETLFSLSRQVPVKSTHVFESPRRKARIETKGGK